MYMGICVLYVERTFDPQVGVRLLVLAQLRVLAPRVCLGVERSDAAFESREDA